MTEKRFKCVSDYDWWGVIDTTGEIKGEYDNNCFSTDTVVDLLNELAEENQHLRQLLDIGKTNAKDIVDVLNMQQRENKELKQLIKKVMDERVVDYHLLCKIKEMVEE